MKSMRIAIICIDSTDNARPYLALGKGLQSAGHAVRILAPNSLASLFSKGASGLDFYGVQGELHAHLQAPAISGHREDAHYSAHFLRVRHLGDLLRHWTKTCLDGCADADMILGGINGMLVGEGVAEKLGIRFVQTHLQSYTPTKTWPSLLFPKLAAAVPGFVRHSAHRITRQMYWQSLRPLVNTTRGSVLGLAPGSFWGNLGKPGGSAVLYGFSPALLPRPADWSSAVHVTGYWFHQEQSLLPPPPASLIKFLQNKPMPVSIDLDGVSQADVENLIGIFLKAIKLENQRGVIICPSGGISGHSLPDYAHLTDYCVYKWLLPQMTFCVHIGSAHATGVTLAAEKPALAIPIGGDQPFWAWILESRELGPKSIPRRRLNPDNLARAINNGINNRRFRENAQRMGMKIRNEDGIGKAAEIISTIR
jgi:sterol 3beta-glucosyltransferase